jgi:hypothetical protein
MKAGFDAFEEAGGDQGLDRRLDLGRAQSLAALLQVRFCQALIARQRTALRIRP